MDRQDFEVTVRETLVSVERAIEELALDGIEAYPTDNGMRLDFDNGGFIKLTRDDAAQQLNLDRGEHVETFYYDSVEEHWFSHESERSLLDTLSAEISLRLVRSVTLSDLL
ncbi:MAG: frataxin domain-containing protein [Bacteroidota bacterium]